MGHDHAHDHAHHHEEACDEPGARPRRRLPVLGEERPLTLLEAAHRAYGGRAVSEPGIGAVVRVRGSDGAETPAVVLFVAGDAWDLCLEDATLVHARADACAPLEGPPAAPLRHLRAEVLRFAALDELDRVRFLVGSHVEHGMVAEKCRYGAVVMRDDGSLRGVSFRDLNPGQALPVGPGR